MENSFKPSDLYPAYFVEKENKATCYGCLACADLCPAHAIDYNADEEGFFYPQLNVEQCIKCGKCHRVCPNEIAEVSLQYPQQCFVGKINDSVEFKKSSSGGAFKSIVKACIKQLGGRYKVFYCAGVKFDVNFQVVNDIVRIDSEDSVDIFSKSKYVQSNPAGIWKRCSSIIKDKNNFLIFTGTPCQTAAMKRIIGEADNVLIIDLICHGAPSQSFFDSYRRKMESEYHSKLVFYEFRTKDILDNGTEYTRSAKYCFANGIEKKVNRLEDSYLIDFYNETFPSRPSCDSCSFKRPERCSDITIGDAWRINQVYPELIPQRGLSVVIASSDKSIELIESVRNEMSVYEISYDFVKENNEPLKQIKKKKTIGYTTGVFDMFHIGHLNILKKAKEQCDYLIVGVSTDENVLAYKNKLPVITFKDRSAIVEAIKYVDKVVPQNSMDKFEAWKSLHFDKLFHGNDWKGTNMYNEVEEKLKQVGVEVVYFEYTQGISSSMLREKRKD